MFFSVKRGIATAVAIGRACNSRHSGKAKASPSKCQLAPQMVTKWLGRRTCRPGVPRSAVLEVRLPLFGEGVHTVEVFDALGRPVILSRRVQGQQMELTLTEGPYLIKATGTNGTVRSQRLIITR